MARRDPENLVVYRKRTFWEWFRGWPLRVVLAIVALFVVAAITTWLDQHVYWFHMLF